MKPKLAFLVIILFMSRMSIGQSIVDTSVFAISLTSQLNELVNSATAGRALGYGMEGAFQYKLPLSKNVSLFVGPSLQVAEVRQRLNELRWPADVINGEWVTGLSYEEYKAIFVSTGASLNLHLNFPGKNPR
jgi:hypothetical protein